jgi:hypothetical protein
MSNSKDSVFGKLDGWNSFKMYHTRWKGPNPCCSPFIPYILIPIKNNE